MRSCQKLDSQVSHYWRIKCTYTDSCSVKACRVIGVWLARALGHKLAPILFVESICKFVQGDVRCSFVSIVSYCLLSLA